MKSQWYVLTRYYYLRKIVIYYNIIKKNISELLTVKECLVPICRNTSDNTNKIFIHVPGNLDIQNSWREVLKLPKTVVIHKNKFICEDHFDLEKDAQNWMHYKIMGKRILLKRDVVPYKYINSPPPIDLSSSFSASARKRKSDFFRSYSLPSTSEETFVRKLFDEGSPIPKMSKSFHEVDSPSGSFEVHHLSGTINCSVGVQVNVKLGIDAATITKKVSFRAENLTDKATTPVKQKLVESNVTASSPSTSSSSRTSSASEYIPSSSDTPSVDDHVMEPNKRSRTISTIQKHPKFYVGVPKSIYGIVDTLSEECKEPKEYILITLQKIRLNDPYFRLGLDFGFSTSRIQQIFTLMVPKMVSQLQNSIFFTYEKSVKKLLPIPFRARYSKVISIIDCFEIEIEKPSDTVAQASTWSEYKHCNTVKLLISCTPNGFNNFISECFAGRISDKDIVVQSKFLEKLSPGCHVMADRGFKHIGPLIEQKKCELIRPPSVGTNQISSKSGVKESKQIASLRIHIERVIRRVREYNILKPHAVVNKNLINDKIMRQN